MLRTESVGATQANYMTDRPLPRLRRFEDAPGQRHIPSADRYLYRAPAPEFRLNVIGTGTIGQEHMRVASLLGRATIHGIFDPSPLSMQIASDEFEKYSNTSLRLYTSAEDAANDPAADAILICTPNFTHLAVLKAAMQSGKPIFLEKPMATTVEDAAEIVRLVNDYPAFVQIGLQYRYKAAYAEARHEVLERASVGKVRTLAMSEYRPPFLDKVGQWNKFNDQTGGTLVEKCCHYFDLLNLFAGGHASRVFATGGQAVNFVDFEYEGRRADIADHAHVIIDYDNDVRAAFTLNMFSPSFSEELIIGGDRGRLRSSEAWDFQNENRAKTTLEIERPEPWASRSIDIAYPAAIETSGHHGATYFEHIAFVNQLAGSKSDSATPTEGLWSVLVASAAQRSMETGQAVELADLIREYKLQDLEISSQ